MLTLGIDIGGTRIKAGLVAGDGTLVESLAEDSPRGLEEFRAAAERITARLAAGGAVAAAGIACKGIINPATTMVEVLPGTLNYLEGHRLGDFVSPRLPPGTPVHADNDARAALAGEVVWGAARGLKDVAMLTLGTGVGGAILSGGRLLRGARGVAGHLGHLTVDPDGPVCICGNRGCLETRFSARAIESEAISAIRRGCASLLTDRFGDCPQTVTCQAVFDAAGEGDFVARVIRDRALQFLAAGAAGVIHAFDPEILIVGGQIAEAGEALLGPLQSEIAWRTRVLLGRVVPVVRPQLAGNAGIAGAAALGRPEVAA